MANKDRYIYTFVMRCETERFGTIKLGYTKKDLELLRKNIGPNGWGNTRIKFHNDNNQPFMVLIPPKDKLNQRDNESVPEEKKPWEKEGMKPPEDLEKKPLAI